MYLFCARNWHRNLFIKGRNEIPVLKGIYILVTEIHNKSNLRHHIYIFIYNKYINYTSYIIRKSIAKQEYREGQGGEKMGQTSALHGVIRISLKRKLRSWQILRMISLLTKQISWGRILQREGVLCWEPALRFNNNRGRVERVATAECVWDHEGPLEGLWPLLTEVYWSSTIR